MNLNKDIVYYINRHLRTAGWHAAQMRAGVEIKTKDAVDDFVTQADKELDVMISAALGKILPGCADFSENNAPTDGLITEERIEQLSAAAARAIASRKRVWYFDPIDGTDNYVKEDGQYCVMLGLVANNQPVYGWIYAPTRDELYFGGPPSEVAESLGFAGLWYCRGGGAPQTIIWTQPKAGSGSPKRLRAIMGSRDRRDHPEIVRQLNPEEWISVGSLGLKVVTIISGAADVYLHFSQQLKFWDTVAPIAVAKAAGLEVSSLNGEEIDFTPHTVAHGAEIFKHMKAVLIGTADGIAEARKRMAL